MLDAIADFIKNNDSVAKLILNINAIPSAEPCEDAISRQAVDELSKELVHTTRDKADFLCHFWEGLQKLPPINPQPKTGQWIEEIDDYGEVIHWHCEKCYEDSGFITTCKWDFCPNCGAKMQTESEDKK